MVRMVGLRASDLNPTKYPSFTEQVNIPQSSSFCRAFRHRPPLGAFVLRYVVISSFCVTHGRHTVLSVLTLIANYRKVVRSSVVVE